MQRVAVCQAAALGGLAAALCFVPLLNVLGYEFCLAICWLQVPGMLALGAVSHVPTRPASAIIGPALLRGSLVLLVPLALIVANALRVQNCNLGRGLAFFALLPWLSACYAIALGLCIRSAFAPWPLGRRPVLWAALCTCALVPLLWALLRLYAAAPICAYSHLWGYFAGSIYDEGVVIDARLVAFRLATSARLLALFAVLVWLQRPRARTWQGAQVRAAAAILCATSWLGAEMALGARLGFSVDEAQLQRVLPQRLSLGAIVLHLPQDVAPRQAQQLLRDCAYRLAEVQRALQLPERARPLHVWSFASAAQKAWWTGGAHTMVAKPWLDAIYIHGLQAPHPLVGHELVHAALADWGRFPLGVPWRGMLWPNMGLVEGVAEAVAARAHTGELQATAACLWPSGTAARIEAAMGGPTSRAAPSFWAQPQGRAYAEAAAFVDWLLERHGSARFLALYRDGDFCRAYPWSLPELIDHFGQALAERRPSQARCREIEAQLVRPSIFARTCAHEIARLKQQRQLAEPQQAVALQRQILAFLPNSRREQIELAGRLVAAGSEAERAEGLKLAEPRPEDDVLLAAEALAASMAAHARAGDVPRAMVAAERGRALQLAGPWARTLYVQRWSLRLPAPQRGCIDALLRGEADPWQVAWHLRAPALAHDPTAQYLLGRQLALRGEPEGIAALEQAGPHPYAPIEAERLRLLATLLWQLGAPPGDFAATLADLEADALPVPCRAFAADMRRRLAFEAASRLPPLPAARR